MKKIYFFTIFLCLIVWSTHISLAEDSVYEKKIYNIYLKHYKDPISNSEWNSKVQALPEKHKLKFKDNLWDLSGSFFKNPLYWSKVWVANPHVENPHLIYEGNFIKFDPQILAEVNTSKYSVDIQSQFPGLVVPKNEFSKKSLSEAEIPSSLPKLSFRLFDNDMGPIQSVEVNKQTIIPFYLTDNLPSIDGEVIGKDDYGKTMGAVGENIIVRIESDVSMGSIFTVFENKDRIGNWFQAFAGLNEKEIMIKGKIKILSYLQGTDSLYMASVIGSMQRIYPGDTLFKGIPQVYNFSQKGTMGAGSGLIIGTSNKNQAFLSLGSIVYLNRGENDGVHKGSIFYIRGNTEKSKIFPRPYNYDQPLLGKLRIIHSTGNVATGIIVESRAQIYVGDRFSGESDRVQNLEESQYHEQIEEHETPEQSGGPLIDFGEGETLTETEDMEGAEDMEEVGGTEDMEGAEDMEEVGGTEDMEGAEDMEEVGGTEDMEDMEGGQLKIWKRLEVRRIWKELKIWKRLEVRRIWKELKIWKRLEVRRIWKELKVWRKLGSGGYGRS